MRKIMFLAGALLTVTAIGYIIWPSVNVDEVLTTAQAASDSDSTDDSYHAYLYFETGADSFRSTWDDSAYGLNGEENTDEITYYTVHSWDNSTLVAASGTFTDAVIDGRGTYTVSVSGLDWTSSEFSASDGKYVTLGISTDIEWDNETMGITVDQVVIGDTVFENPDFYNEGINSDSDYWVLDVESSDVYEKVSLGTYDATSSYVSITFTITYAGGNSGTCGDDVTWEIDDDGVLSISGTGAMYDYSSGSTNPVPWYDFRDEITSIVIEDGITHISDYAFYYCRNLQSVDMPDTLESIGQYAFGYAESLEGIEIPESVTEIGEGAFSNCISLTALEIPESFTSVPEGLLSGCTAIESFTVPANVTSISRIAFQGCTALTSIEIKGELTSIGASAFARSAITSIEINEGVTSIGKSAFYECTALTDVVIPDTVTSIGEQAFYGCSGMSGTIDISSGVEYIGESAFAGCGVSAINVDEDNPYYMSDDGVLYNKDHSELICCPAGKEGSYDILDGTATVCMCAFYMCEKLTAVTIPDTVTFIDVQGFYGCSGLTSVSLPEGMTSDGMEENAFGCCTGLEYIIIPEGFDNITAFAFAYCSSLKKVFIYANVKRINYGAFYECNSITDVFYSGSKSDWKEIIVDQEEDYSFDLNGTLMSSTMHYNASVEDIELDADVDADK